MKTLVALYSLPFCSLVPAAWAPQTLELALAADAELRTRLVLQQENAVVGGRMSAGGQTEEMPDEVGFAQTESIEVTVLDRFPAGADGPEAEVHRTFERIRGKIQMDLREGPRTTEVEIEHRSELAGESVRFFVDANGDPKCEALDPKDELDERWLEHLAVDFGGWCLLPDDEVEVGDTWKVDEERVRQLIFPGGTPALFIEDPDQLSDDDDGPDAAVLLSWASLENPIDTLRAEIVATYQGAEGGIATIDFLGSIDGSTNALADARTMAEALDGAIEGELTRLRVEHGLSIEGTLAWNMDTGCLASLEWTAETETRLRADIRLESKSRTLEQTIEFELEGEASLELAIARR